LSFMNYKHPRRVVPATISVVVAVVLSIVCIFLISDRFLTPEVKTTAQAEHSTTGMVARDAGAQLSPTEPKLSVEPAAPKVAQPADQPAPDSAPR
jgi:hypothetical protein